MSKQFKQPGRPPRGPCAAQGCDRGAVINSALGLVCNLHYQRALRYGAFDVPVRKFSRHVQCAQCGKDFDRGYAIGARRAKNKQFCSLECSRARCAAKVMPRPRLVVIPSPRLVRHKYLDASGYVRIYAPEHPLAAMHQASLREHRVVMYNCHGIGPYSCHWCGGALEWKTMHIDHLDDDKTNNDITNLVSACPMCNINRGRTKQLAAIRAKRPLTHSGRTMCLSEWARELRVSRYSLPWRLDHGWTLEEVLTTPRGKAGPRSQRYG